MGRRFLLGYRAEQVRIANVSGDHGQPFPDRLEEAFREGVGRRNVDGNDRRRGMAFEPGPHDMTHDEPGPAGHEESHRRFLSGAETLFAHQSLLMGMLAQPHQVSPTLTPCGRERRTMAQPARRRIDDDHRDQGLSPGPGHERRSRGARPAVAGTGEPMSPIARRTGRRRRRPGRVCRGVRGGIPSGW